MNIRKQTTDRRHFLKAGAMTFGALGMGSIAPFLQKSLAGDLPPGKKLLFIFLRGAMDGLDVVRPVGDPAFAAARLRSTSRGHPRSRLLNPVKIQRWIL